MEPLLTGAGNTKVFLEMVVVTFARTKSEWVGRAKAAISYFQPASGTGCNGYRYFQGIFGRQGF